MLAGAIAREEPQCGVHAAAGAQVGPVEASASVYSGTVKRRSSVVVAKVIPPSTANCPNNL